MPGIFGSEILTGNLLSDNVTYHASDFNAAINGATILPGIITNRSTQEAQLSDRILSLSSSSSSLISSTLQSVVTLALTNLVTVGPANIAQGVQLSGLLPVSVNGTQNDYNPTNFDKCTILAVVGTVTFTGFQAGPTGTIKIIINAAGGVVTLSRENAASAALNRITYGAGADITLATGQTALCIYDSVRWRVLCTNRTL